MSLSFEEGEKRREKAKQFKQAGLTNIEIGKLLGVTPQHVSYMLNDGRRRRATVLRQSRKRRSGGARLYRCGVCGERGHNAQRHDHLRPEDVDWLRRQRG